MHTCVSGKDSHIHLRDCARTEQSTVKRASSSVFSAVTQAFHLSLDTWHKTRHKAVMMDTKARGGTERDSLERKYQRSDGSCSTEDLLETESTHVVPLLSKEDEYATHNDIEGGPPQSAARAKGLALKLLIALIFGVSWIFLFTEYLQHNAEAASTKNRKGVTRAQIARQRLLRKESTPNVHVVMMATKANPNFCKSLFSLLVNGYPAPRLPRYGHKFEHGLLDKIETFANYSASHPAAKDRLILLDGYDVWAQLSIDALEQRYAATGKDFIIGADKKCWPNDRNSDQCKKMPQSPLPDDVFGAETDKGDLHMNRPRWINSGTFIGLAEPLSRLLNETVKHMRSAYDAKQLVDDQKALHEIFTQENQTYNYSLDYRLSFFHMWGFNQHDLSWTRNLDAATPATVLSANPKSHLKLNLTDIGLQTSQQRRQSVWRDRPLLHNHAFNVIPTILHFAGPQKGQVMKVWWPSMWFMQPEVHSLLLASIEEESHPGGAGAWLNESTWKSWTELCGRYDLRR